MSPRNVLHADAVRRAGHTTGRIKKVDDNPPERDKEPAPLGQLVIARTRLLASGTFPANAPVGVDPHFDPPRRAHALQANAVINEADKTLYLVQEGLNLQLSSGLFVHTRFNTESVK